jgi:signal transduction histidine kinase
VTLFPTGALSVRLLGIFLIEAVLVILAVRLAVQWVYGTDYLRELVSGHLQLHVDYVLADIGDPPDLERARRITEKVPVDLRVEGPGIDWTSDPDFPPLAALAWGGSELFGGTDPDGDAWLERLDGVEFARYGEHDFIKLTQGAYAIGVASPKMAMEPRSLDITPVITAMALAILLSAYLAVRWLFLPLKQIRDGMRRMARGDLAHRIPVSRSDELGDLAVGINDLASEVRDMLDAKRQLLLAISHELRSPLTRSKVALEFVEDERLRKTLLDDVQEMENVIADLLEGERLNTRHATLYRSTVRLGQLIEATIAEYFPEQRERVRIVMFEGDDEADIDAPRVTVLVKNLVDNALRHSPDGREVELTAGVVGRRVVIEVRDRGEGIAPEHLDRVTEPFYRADPSRRRGTGGYGLGLYLCRLIAEAHGGHLLIDSARGEGTLMRAEFPAAASGSGALGDGPD